MTDTGASRASNRSAYLIAATAVLAAASALEFVLVPTGIWRDEATSYFESALPSFADVLARVRVSEINPPLFFFILHAWIPAAGRSTFALRLLPYALSLGTLVELFVLARRSADRFGALVAIAFVGANAVTVQTASELRPYALAGLLLTASVLATERYVATSRRRYLATVAIANAAVIYATYVGGIAVVALAIAGVLFARSRGEKIAIAAAGAVLPLLCALPLLPLEHVQAASQLVSPTKGNLRPGDFLSYVSRAIPDFTLEARKPQMLAGFLIAAVLAYAAWRYAPRRGSPHADPPLALAAATFVFAAFGDAASGLETPRYIAPVVPLGALALGLTLAHALASLRARSARAATALGILAIVLPLLGQFAIIRAVARQPKSAMQAIARDYPAANETSLALVVAPDFAAQTLAFYEGTAANVYGFARWDRPDVFDLPGYDVLWRSPAALPDTLARIAALARGGVKRLVFVRLEPKYTGLPATGEKYRLVDALLARLRERYGAPRSSYYPAQVEDATAYVFTLRRSAR